ncbi:MAG: aldo/keto reductase, partial [Clostridiales Family XIII bacterium]|jgi:predicted aldo/keto reductase-like oxidoreductase|nr:aldo/keto reductase [Clostridiales Family XIII bacterium]
MRDRVLIASKTMAKNANDLKKDLETSLKTLRTDYIDVYQLHNPGFCPKPGDESGLYDALLTAREEGKIRFLGFTNHRIAIAEEMVSSGLYDVLQFPFNYLSTEREIRLVQTCAEKKIGFVAMKSLSGGLLTNSAAACAYLTGFENVIPIWGIQREKELDEFLSFIANPPILDKTLQQVIDTDRKELSGDFCRGCGYCKPCPSGIEIDTCARASLLLRRAPTNIILSENGQASMQKIPDCIECGQCKERCPYGLDIPELLKKNYLDFQSILNETNKTETRNVWTKF